MQADEDPDRYPGAPSWTEDCVRIEGPVEPAEPNAGCGCTATQTSGGPGLALIVGLLGLLGLAIPRRSRV